MNTRIISVGLFLNAMVSPLFHVCGARGEDILAQARSQPAQEFAHSVRLECSLDALEFEAREPVIARVRLTNVGDQILRLKVRPDGAPYAVALLATADDGVERPNTLRLRRVGPDYREMALQPGQATTGEVLLFFGLSSGFAFPSPGRYSVRFRWLPGEASAPAYTREIEVNVVRQSRHSVEFLRDLDRIASEYYGYDPDLLDRIPEEERVAGVRLLARMISRDKPDLVDPENRPEDRKKARLLDTLSQLLEQHPDTYYSGYIARYLGLTWRANRKSVADEYAIHDQPFYATVLQHLDQAEKYTLWPRASATFWKGHTYVAGQEWDKVAGCCRTLRSRYDASNGAGLADELTAAMEKFRAKVQRHRRAQNNEGPK